MSRENKTTEKQLSDPEYFYEFMGHPPLIIVKLLET